MDILISSNLERLLYHESGEDSEYIKKLMNELNASGKYEINKDLKKKLKKIFYAEYAGEEETKTTIREMYNDMKYLIDTHTAVGLTVARKYQKKTGDKKPMLIASTASAYKFAPAVLNALQIPIEGMNEFEMAEKLNKITSVEIPKGLKALKKAKVLHEDICEKEEMSERVLTFAGN